MSSEKRILVTGGAGFIGSNFLSLMVPRFPHWHFLNVDNLTYAGNLHSLAGIDTLHNYSFSQVDITDADAIQQVFTDYQPDWVIHFAAESHVDRSIVGPKEFIVTNILGTFNLLESCRAIWKDSDGHLFHHVSTDEVYGSLGAEGYFTELTAYDPSSPYSASKAGSDHLVRAYYRTYDLPVKITNCSNNYGPRQFPEKLIPLMILNCLERKPLPVYGDGGNVRDWLHVDDHCEAILTVAQSGRAGETYNVGGNSERTNLIVVRTICQIVAEELGVPTAEIEGLINFVTDRPGHDRRYAIDASKLSNELGWTPKWTFEDGMRNTVRWYLKNMDWVDQVRTGAYRQWLTQNYEDRESS
ncbi:MAG: dTDP-glucose 4,6-dehydratase [bacterium]